MTTKEKKARRKPGPKKKFVHETKIFCLHLPEPIYSEIKTLAEEQTPQSSVTNLIQLALYQFLNRRGCSLPDKL